MPLKFRYKKKEEVPAEHVALYKETELELAGAKETYWMLECEGAVDAGRLDEFRKNNVKVSKELAEIKATYDGIDATVARDLLAKKEDLENEKLFKKGDIDTIVSNRTKAMKEANDKVVANLQEANAKALARLTEVEITQAAVTEGTKLGLKATAVQDLTNRAKAVFKLVDGKVVALDSDGKSVRFGTDGVTPFSISDWAKLQVTEAPHLFEESKGGGSGGSGGGTGGGTAGPNPWKQETFNLTRQFQIQKADPAGAKRLKIEAGIAV